MGYWRQTDSTWRQIRGVHWRRERLTPYAQGAYTVGGTCLHSCDVGFSFIEDEISSVQGRPLAFCGGMWYHFSVFDSGNRRSLTLSSLAAHLSTVALCEGGSGERGCRAEADRVIRGSQNLAQAVHHGGGTRSWRIPKGLRRVRNRV